MARQTEITLDDRVFQQLLNTLDKIEAKLTDIGNTTDRLQKRTAKVEFKFGGVDIFTKFVDAITPQKVNQIVKLVDSMEKLSGIDFGKIKFDTITDGLEKISKLSVGQDLEEITKAVSRLGSGFGKLFGSKGVDPETGKGIKSLVESLSFGNSAKLAKNILVLQTLLGFVGLISSKLPGQNTVRELSLTFERLGIGISGLFKNIDKIDTRSTAKLAALLTGLTLGFNVLSRFAGNTEKIRALASAFTGVASLFDAVFKGIDIKNVGKSKEITKVLKERISFLAEVIKALRGLTGGVFGRSKAEELSAIGDAFNGIGKLFEAVSGEGEIDDKTIRSLKGFISVLADLNNVKVNKNTANALLGLGQIFSNAGLADLRDNAERVGGTLGTNFGKSIVEGFLKVEIVKVIGRVLFGDLNPAVLLAKFTAGVAKAFVSLDQQITTILNNIVAKAKSFGSTITSIGNNLINSFGIGNITSSPGFAIATEFDDLSKKAQVFGNLSEEELGKVLDLADAIGIKYPLSANAALQAINNLQKAGLGVPDIEGAIAPIADLASLSDSGDIGQASQIVIQAVNSFKEISDGVNSSFDNTADIVNILSSTADKSTASVESLGQGLANVGPIASAFGLNFQETNAILALFEDNGIHGAEAGTQLKSVLSNLTRPTKAVQAELTKLGISLTDDQGNFRDINSIINDFNKAFNETKIVTTTVSNLTDDQSDRLAQAQKAYAKATTQISLYNDGLTTGSLNEQDAAKKIGQFTQIQANAQAVIAEITGSQAEAERITTEITRTQKQNFQSIQTIFGTFGQQGAAILINSGTDAIQNFIDSTEGLPTAAERAQQLLDTFKGSTEQLQGSIETLLKNAFLPLIDTIFKPLTDGALAFVNALLLLDPEIIAVTSTAITFGAILASIIGTVALITGGLITLGATVAGLIVPFTTFTGTLSILAGLIGSFVGFVTGLISFVAIAGPLAIILVSIASGFRTIISLFTENIGGANDGLTAFTDSIGLVIDGIGEFAGAVGTIINIITGGGQDSLESAGTSLKTFFEGLAKPVKDLGSFLFDAASGIRAFVRFFNGAAINDNALANLAENPFLSGILDKVGLDKSADGLKTLFSALQTGLNQVKGAFILIGQGVSGFITLLTSGGGVDQALDFASRSFQAAASRLGSVVLNVVQSLFGVDLSKEIADLDAGNLSDALSSLFFRAIQGIKDFIVGNRAGIQGIISGLLDIFFVPGKLAGAIGDFLGITQIGDIFDEIERIVKGLFGGIADTIINLIAGDDIATAVRKAFGPGVQPIIDFVTALGDLVTNVVGLLGDLFSELAPTGDSVAQFNLLDVITAVVTTLTSAITFLSDKVITPLRNILRAIDFQKVFDFINNLFASFGNFFRLLFSGDFSGALTQLGDIGKTIGGLLQDVISNIFGVEFTPNANVIQSVAEAFAGIIKFALDGVANLLGFDSFTTLGETVINQVVTSIQNFLGPNPAEKFASIAGDIIAGLGNAIINAFNNIGDILNIDTTDAQSTLKDAFQKAIDDINAFFTNNNETTLFDNIATIFEKIATALQKVFDLFNGGNANQGTQKAFTLQDALKGIVDFASNLISLGIETLTEPLKGIGDFIQKLSELPPEKLTSIAAAVAGIVGSLVLLNPTVAGGISSVVSSLTSIAGLASVLLIVKNFATNASLLVDAISALLDLDIASAAGSLTEFVGLTASGITFDVLGLFGIDSIFGQTEEDINNTVSLIAGGVSTLLTQVGQSLVDFFNNTVIPVINTVQNIVSPILEKFGIALRVIGTIVFSPIIILLKAIQGFANLPQEQKDRVISFFTLLGSALLIFKGLQLVSAAGGISGIISAITSGGPAILTALQGIGTAIGAFGTAIAGFVSTVVVPFLGIVAVLITLSSVINNLDKFFSAIFNLIALLDSIVHLDVEGIFTSFGNFIGDLIDFVLSTFKDIVGTIMDLLGIETIFGQTKEDIETTINEIVTIIKLAFKTAGIFISNFFKNTFDDLSTKFNILIADIGLGISDAAARIRTIGQDASQDPFFKAQAIFADPENIDLSALSAAIGDASVSQSDLDLFARKNAGQIINSLTTALGDPALVPNVDVFQNVLSKLDLSGSLDNATRTALESSDPVIRQSFLDLFAQALQLPPDQRILTTSQIQTITGNIINEITLGNVTTDQALNILDLIPIGTGPGTLTQEQKDALKKQILDLQAEADQLVKDSQTTPGTGDGTQAQQDRRDGVVVTPSVSVEPVVTTDPATIKDDINTKVQESIDQAGTTDTGTPVTAAVPVTPEFENLTSTEDVQQAALDFTVLNTNIQTTKTSFDDFATKVNDNITNLQLLSDKVTEVATNFTTQTTTITATWATVDTLLSTSLTNINNLLAGIILKIFGLSLALLVNNPVILTQLTILQTNFTNTLTAIIIKLGLVLAKLNDINFMIATVLGGLQKVATSSVQPGSQPPPDGRAQGGPVNKGIFEVIENRVPELLSQDGKTFLLSPGPGNVTPLTPLAQQTFGGLPPAASASRSPIFGGGGGTAISITEGDIVVQINGSTGDTASLIPQIQEAVRVELNNRNNNMRDKLRTAGRS